MFVFVVAFWFFSFPAFNFPSIFPGKFEAVFWFKCVVGDRK